MDGSNASIWVKLEGGKTVCLTDYYWPSFYVELNDGFDPYDVVETMELHPSIAEALVEENMRQFLIE